MKRRIALGFLAFLAATIGGALWLASTPWAGRKLCDLATTKVREAAGVEVAVGACRVRPLRLAVELDEVRVGPLERPIFAADAVSVQIAPLQALSKTIALDEVSVVRPRVNLVLPPADPGREARPVPAAAPRSSSTSAASRSRTGRPASPCPEGRRSWWAGSTSARSRSGSPPTSSRSSPGPGAAG